jgi:sugar phosphate isomerase/epimerase
MKKIFLILCLLISYYKNFSQTTKGFKIGVQMWTFHISPFFDAINRIDSAGLHFVEIYPGQKMGNSMVHTMGPQLTTDERQQVKAALKAKHISIAAYGVVGCDKLEEWKAQFEFCQSMNIPVMTAEPDPKHLDEVNKLAGEYKIKVAIHNHPQPSHYWHPDSVLAAIKNRPNIGACADIGHWVRHGLNVAECLQKLKGRVWDVHFKDVAVYNVVESPDVFLGTGVCNIPAVMKELKKQNFIGCLSIEHEVNWTTNVQEVIVNRKYYEGELKKIK